MPSPSPYFTFLLRREQLLTNHLPAKSEFRIEFPLRFLVKFYRFSHFNVLRQNINERHCRLSSKSLLLRVFRSRYVLNLRYVSGPATINNDGKFCLAKKFSRGEFLKEQQSGSVAMKNELRVCETFECVYRLSFCFLLLIETNYRLCCSPFVSL